MRPIAVPLPLFVAAAVVCAACGPSIDPAAKADIDRRAAALQAGTNAFPTPAPGMFAPMPFAVGQWTQYRMTDDKNQPSFLTYKLVGQDADAVWLEMVNEGYQARQSRRCWSRSEAAWTSSQVQVRAMTMKDAKGNVTEMPPTVIWMMQSTYQSAVSMLVLNWQGLPQENAAVPAGRFDGRFKARTEAQWGPGAASPIPGLIRRCRCRARFARRVSIARSRWSWRLRHQRRRQRALIPATRAVEPSNPRCPLPAAPLPRCPAAPLPALIRSFRDRFTRLETHMARRPIHACSSSPFTILIAWRRRSCGVRRRVQLRW